MSDNKLQIQEPQSTTSRINTKTKTKKLYLGIFKLQKLEGKEKILKESKGGGEITLFA